MTENIYRTRAYKPDPSTFGGYIYLSDFETDLRGKNRYKGSPLASRILSDFSFDEECRNNIRHREQQRNCRKESEGGSAA